MSYYQEAICNLDMRWAIENGWSVPPVCRLAKIQELDLSGVKVSGEDFNQAQLQAAVEKEASLHRIALVAREESEGPTVVFTPSVASAKGVCHYLANNYGMAASYVYGTQPEEERNEAIRLFKSGQTRVLVNCQVVAVGFDHPAISTLILGRPTRSRSFWLQCVGRATRPLPGTVDFHGSTVETRKQAIAASGKPRFKIIDCTDASVDHRLVTSVDMFATCPKDKEVRQVVAKACAEKPLTPEEIEALAQKEYERQEFARNLEERRKKMQGQATGKIWSEDIDIEYGERRSVGTYMNPLRGKYAGMRMSELPDFYIRWASENQNLSHWIRSTFIRERRRRRGVARTA
jgi:superfamily II DNA or RNA helicase